MALLVVATFATFAALADSDPLIQGDGRGGSVAGGVEERTDAGAERASEGSSSPRQLDDAGADRWLLAEAAPATPTAVAAVGLPGEAMGDPAQWNLSIPAVDVTASMMSLGVDPAGVMEVPNDGETVGWYRFTAVPGEPGNAVVAAHVDYRGRAAVFHGLQSLQATDQIIIEAGGTTLTYSVDSITLVRPEAADVTSIVGPRYGLPTLTLITCGGAWDRARGDYDHRVIVTASLVSSKSFS